MGRDRTAKRCFHISKNGAVKVYGHHPASMDRSGMDGGLWRGAYRIRRSQMQNRYVQAPYLSPGFSDFAKLRIYARLGDRLRRIFKNINDECLFLEGWR